MIRMIKFELKKLFSNSIVIGSIVVLLLVCFFILQACCFNNSATSTVLPDGTQLSGRQAIVYNQTIAEKYAGDFTDDTIAKMVTDFSEDYPNEYSQMVKGDVSNSALPSTFLYLNMFIPPANYDEIVQDAIAHGSSIPPLTNAGLVSIADYGTAYIDKPLQCAYNDSWAYFFTGFCGPTIAIAFPTLIVLVIAISTVFSSEYSTKMDALILTTKYGKNKQIIAKLLTSIIFTTILVVGLFFLYCVAFGVHYGLVGWNADIQTNLGLSLLGVEIPMNNFQLIFFGLMIVWLAGVFTSTITAMISAITKTPFSSLIVALAVFIVPWLLRQILPENTLRDILLIFPANAVNVQEVLILPVNDQSIYFNQPLAPALSIIITTIIVLLASSIITYRSFSKHQSVN